MIIKLKENRLKIFAGILISSLFIFPLIGYLYIILPIIDRISELTLKEVILFGGTSVLCLLGLCLLLVSVIFMLFKIFNPAQIILSQEGIRGRTTQGIVAWDDIEKIDYLSFDKKGLSIITLFITIASISSVSALIYSVRAFILLNSGNTLGIIRLTLKNQKQILLDIDECFFDGKHTALDIIKEYKNARIRGSYYLKQKLQELVGDLDEAQQ